jgi:hypothetical protein
MKCRVIDRKVDLKTEAATLKLVDLPVPFPFTLQFKGGDEPGYNRI